MSTEIIEEKEETVAAPDKEPEENQYKIFNYFKEHTGLLVTCVSALVAVMSFIFRFAVSRMNYVYLAYWDIASLHANTHNQNELDMLVCALLYMLSAFLIHSFLGKTSDTYRYYNELLSIVKRSINLTKETNKLYSEKLRTHENSYNLLSSIEKDTPEAKDINKWIQKSKELLENSTSSLKELGKARIKLILWVALQIFAAIILSYFIGSLFLILFTSTVSIQDGIQRTRSIIFIIVVDLIMYFVPAYFATRNSAKNLTNEEILLRTTELIEKDIPKFPIQDFVKNGFMSILTDKKIKLAIAQSIVITVVLLFVTTLTGTLTAKQQRSFPIYTEGSTSYAVVYTSGSTRFMEEATISDGTIVIDTTKQRVLTSDDISYDIKVFNEVSIIKIDNSLKFEQNTVSTESFFDKFGLFFESLLDKLEEAMDKNAECIPGTEHQP